jgi:hypothetical protein
MRFGSLFAGIGGFAEWIGQRLMAYVANEGW